MLIENIPQVYKGHDEDVDLFIYDLMMQRDIIKAKVNLTTNMFSFLQAGKKQLNLPDASVTIDSSQSILIRKGNCIWSELINKEENYHCRLFFFSEDRLISFFQKYPFEDYSSEISDSHFIIENDAFINSYLGSLSTILSARKAFATDLLPVKFEELLLYLINKYGHTFKAYLLSLISMGESSFDKLVLEHAYSGLSLEEIAFLSHMSLSTFKRNFRKKYGVSPGKWFKDKRLERAKYLLRDQKLNPSDVYRDVGYNNLSNFSAAFKKKYGISPSEMNV